MAARTIRFKSKREEASRSNRPTRFSQRLNPPHSNFTVASIPRDYGSRFAHLAVSASSAQTTSYCRTKDFRPVSNQATSSTSDAECFLQRLPEKLRARIWDFARARTIEIVVHNGLVCCRSPSPITFKINKESRYEFFGLYTFHTNFYISGTEYTEKAPYPFFDPAVDSVLVKDSLPGYDPATSRVPLGFYRTPLVVHYSHLDIFRSLHVAAQPRNWSAISRSPQAYVCFANLAEIVFQGGSEGLINQSGINNCKQVVRACFENSLNNSRARRAGATANAIKTPVVRVIMPKGLGFYWAFSADQLGMESIEERAWVLNFIKKVDDSRE